VNRKWRSGYPSASPLSSFPFFATAEHHHTSYRNQTCRLRVPLLTLPLASQKAPASPSPSSLLPGAANPAHSFPSHPGGLSPIPSLQNGNDSHHQQPRTFPGQVCQGGTHFYTNFCISPSEMLRDNYLSSPVTPAPAFLLKKLVLASALDTAI